MASNRYRWRIFAYKLTHVVPFATVFGFAVGALAFKPRLLSAALASLSGTIDITILMIFISGAETFLPGTRLGRALARLSFFGIVAVKSVVYMGVVAAVVFGRPGPHIALLTVDAPTAQSFIAQLDAILPKKAALVMMANMLFLMICLRQVSLLVGERTIGEIIRGRYRRPRREERFFLFVDIVGSTPIAERLGPVAVHHYLDRVFQLASDPIDDHDGSVVQYIGDEIIVTWNLRDGCRDARPLACLFTIDAALADAAAEFEREFGAVPKLRAALHAGEVVTGETGGSRRAIVFTGDVMNTTSRIENATRALNRPYLVSEDALKRMDGTAAYSLEDLGPQQLRGKENAMRVFAVSLPPS